MCVCVCVRTLDVRAISCIGGTYRVQKLQKHSERFLKLFTVYTVRMFFDVFPSRS